MATRSPALGLNTVFNRRERLNGGKVSGTVSFVWAIIGQKFVLGSRLVKESITQYVTESVTDAWEAGDVFRGGGGSAFRRMVASLVPHDASSRQSGSLFLRACAEADVATPHRQDHRLIAGRASS